MKILLIAFLVYLAFQFIFRLVIPVYLASRHIKKGFRDMHTRMQQMQEEQTHTGNPGSQTGYRSSPASGPAAGDYIDFEEVK